MNLRATHRGYAYQDLVTGIAFVDLMLGTADTVTVDTKGFPGDLFDDLTIDYRAGGRVRIQIKHTSSNRKLSKESFSAHRRSLRVDLLFRALLSDLDHHPGTTYRVVVRDGDPDGDLAAVLKPVAVAHDPGDPLPGLVSRRFKFDPSALVEAQPWKSLLAGLSDVQIRTACAQLTIDTRCAASTLDISNPGPAERVLMRRVVEELGAGRPPNASIAPEYAALALAHAATGARALDGHVTRERLAPQLGLTTDFGAVVEGHPVEPAVAVHRAGAVAKVREQIDTVIRTGGRAVVLGEPGVGKSWLCEQLANVYRDDDWIVVRHHCWLGSADVNRDERVLTDVVLGSLLRQLEHAVPEATIELRPRFAATPEALAASLHACRNSSSQRNVLIIVDGLDHVDRVLGRRTKPQIDPSRLLVDQLAAIELPPGVCLLIASQPGAHLANAAPATGAAVEVNRMSWEEVASLTTKHGLLDGLGESERLGADEERVVDLVHSRSGGNALYATYLCRYATRVSPLVAEDRTPVTVNELIHRLTLVPDTATDVDAYYAHLLNAMTPDQEFAVGTLALCEFALSADELGEILPSAKPLLKAALATLAPVLNSQPGLGGLRIHHESFSRHILRDRDEGWVRSIRDSAVAWLAGRGFFTDARALRHLPQLLAHLDRYDELKELIQPGFVAEGIRAFQPPEALARAAAIVAREAESRLDWPTLITCVETRKSIDTYESQSLTDSIVEHADVVVSILGAHIVAERLMYEGRTTLPSRWGLRICEAVDRAGAAAPWKAYIDAREAESKRDHTRYSSDSDGTLQLAVQLGELRLRAQRGDIPPNLAEQVAAHLALDHDAPLEGLVEVFTAGLPAGTMPNVAAMMTNPGKAARVFMALVDLAATGTPGLPDPIELARQAWQLAPGGDIISCLKHGIPPADVLAGLGIGDLQADLQAATYAVLAGRTVDNGSVRRWLSLLTLAQALDPRMPLRSINQLTGDGFYRAWLRYAIATIGIATDVTSGVATANAASSAVVVALAGLAAEADPFKGTPRACDLYFIHPLIHEVLQKSLTVVQPADLDRALEHLVAIGNGTTTTTNFGLAENGPLATNDLLEILSRLSGHIGTSAVHALMAVIRDRRHDTNTQYAITADFELRTARICLAAGANDDAHECWRRACLLLASYGGHKDPTISEIIDSVVDIADVDVDAARACLAKLVDLVYLVQQHTDGRGTSHFVNSWWEKASTIDPTAAAIDGADTLLAEVGFDDGRVRAAHSRLLDSQVAAADPIVLAALRLTVGTNWRRPTIDLELLTRLEAELRKPSHGDVMIAIVANNIAATYDDQPMQYSNDQPNSVVTPQLVDVMVRLGGAAFSVRAQRPEQPRSSPSFSTPNPDPLELQKRLESTQRPVFPAGRTGAILAARDFSTRRYREGAGVRWELDAVANAIGWRILETTLTDGAEAAIELIDDVAREIPRFSDNEIFAALGEGLAARCDGTDEPMNSVASYCLALAYVRIRGGGGWRTFAGREQVRLWTAAHGLDSATAERTLAAAVAAAVESDAQGTYGVTQATIAAFATTRGGTAIECWEAAFPVIQHRLPGRAELSGHTYRPTATPDSLDAVDTALATLALANISQPLRADLRQTLLATALLLTCRPAIAQAALSHVLRSGLDAGRASWLLDVVYECLPAGELTDEMAAELARLAGVDWLSVRALASRVLNAHGRPVPNPPATAPLPKVRAAFHELMGERA